MENNYKQVQHHLSQAYSLVNDAIEEYTEAYKIIATLPICKMDGDFSPLKISNVATSMCNASYILYWMLKQVADVVQMSETQQNQFDK